ncbi:DNA-directed DNA polymerase [Tanacetum coccineum]
MAQVQKLFPDQLQEEFDKIQRAVAFTRGLKRDGSPMTSASSKKLKTGDVEVNVKAPSHGIPQEEKGATPSQNVSRKEVAAPSHSQDIPEAQVEVPSQEATIEDVEVPSNIASTAQHTASSLKKVGTKKKRLGRKGVHTSQSTIPIEEGDPEYALRSINAIYRLDNSRKYFTSLREILHLVTRADLMTIYGRVMTFYQDKKAAGVGLVLWGDLKVLMDSPEVNDGSDKISLFGNLIERMLDHQLEICHGTVGNELTTAVQLIAFLKKQISDSKRPKVHEWVFNSPMLLLLRVEMVINPPWIMPLLGTEGLASPNANGVWVFQFTNDSCSKSWTAEVVPKSVAGSRFFVVSSTLLPVDVQVQQDFCWSVPGYEANLLRKAALRSHQNYSLANAGRNLFDDEASLSNNTEPKPPTPPKTLHEHSLPTSSGFQNPITVPTEQTGRIVDSRDIWLIQNTCAFQGLRTEDPFRHVKHYLSIIDNIQADGAIRDTSRIRLFHFSFKGKAAEWLDRIPPTQVTTWDQLVLRFLDHFFPVGRTSALRDLILRFKQGDDKPIKSVWIRFQDLINQIPHHGIQKWLMVQIFHDNISQDDRRKLDQFT